MRAARLPTVPWMRRSSPAGTGPPGCRVGAFMSPLLLTWADSDAPEVHSLEAFGPVSSVIGYDDVADAIRLAALGAGSLVATVATNDSEVARELVTGIAAHHGRFWC